jgi:hypothetical protein
MANLKFFVDNFDQLLGDAKVQVESLSNDFKELPDAIQGLLYEGQEKLQAAKEQADVLKAQILTGEIFQNDYKPEIQRVVSELESATQQIFESIKIAINNAK